ncbi:hypothetical protein [Streptomyces sp. NPDC094049]|uniref:hypothetical protein n=1 Tax=Streptomyces sp. NPDC094049 TaxID=3154987 RepID=UPI00332B1CD6
MELRGLRTQGEITEYVDASDGIASIAVAARPVMPHLPQPVAEEILRDGWRIFLHRTDDLATEYACRGHVLGAA